jgi:hypothetical protein
LLVQTIDVATELITTDLVLDVDYTVSGAGDENGGNVTFINDHSPMSSLYNYIITRNVPQTQESSFADNAPTPASVHENALDKLTMITQRLQEQVNRAYLLPADGATVQSITDTINAAVATAVAAAAAAEAAAAGFPAIVGVENAGKVVMINSAGDGFECKDFWAAAPIGTIRIFEGAISEIEEGWHLMDGTSGTTADIRNCFIVCAQEDEDGVAKTNIEGTLEQSGGNAEITQTGAQVGDHVHDVEVYEAGTTNAVIGASNGGAKVGDSSTVGSGTPEAMNIVNPYYAFAIIQKVS